MSFLWLMLAWGTGSGIALGIVKHEKEENLRGEKKDLAIELNGVEKVFTFYMEDAIKALDGENKRRLFVRFGP